MADILISKFTTQIPRVGATPATPGFAESEGQDPVAPSGTPQVYTPVTIGSPANGLSISGTQVLTIGLASTSTTGALSSTDWNTFNGKLNLTSPITGYTVGANTALAATDTILQAFGKVQGQINARISGTIASGQVAFGTGVNTVGGDAGFTYDSANDRFTIGGASLFGNNNIDFISSPTSQIYATSNTGVAEPFQLLGNLVIAPRTNASLSTYFVTNNGSNVNWRWRIISSGILESRESNSIVARTGSLSFRSDGGNGSLFFTPNGTGGVCVGPATAPTNTLDVNGTARIRTISNLGSAATSVLVPSATGVLSLRTLAELASDGGFTNLWTLTGSDIYRNSKVTIGQTTIIDADLGIKQVDTDSALRIDGLARTTRRTILSVYEGSTLRHTVDNYGIPAWRLFTGSAEGGAITFSTPLNRIGVLIASDLLFTSAERGELTWSPTLTGVTDISVNLTSRNTSRLQFGATGHFAIGNTSLISDSFGVINPNPSVTNALRILDGSGNTNLLVINNGDIQYRDGGDFILGTTTGTRIGTATNQRLAFWNATPIVQPTTAVASATLVSNAGTTITSTDTIDGYTLQQVVRALRNTGLLA